ncbi:CsgG/HfaB family protein [Gemmatimonadota bacterium]
MGQIAVQARKTEAGMMSPRPLPRWKRWIGITTAALMLTLSVGPSLALAAAAHADRMVSQPRQEQQQQEQLTIGVIDLDANGVEEGEALAITERFRTYLGRTGIFAVIERNQMESIMTEMGFQASGACNTDECVVQVGEVLGASKMVAGSVSKVGNLYSLQIRMIDIATSRIENPLFEDVNGIEDVLTDATLKLANDLAELVRQQLGVPFQPVPPEEQAQQQADPARQQDDPVTPPVTEEQPGEEETQPGIQQPRRKFPWWIFLLGAAGGGAAYLLSGNDPGSEGPAGSGTIGTPPDRPTIPPR